MQVALVYIGIGLRRCLLFGTSPSSEHILYVQDSFRRVKIRQKNTGIRDIPAIRVCEQCRAMQNSLNFSIELTLDKS